MKSHPAHFFCDHVVVSQVPDRLSFLVLAGISSVRAGAPGFLEGHLKIVSLKQVEIGDEMPRPAVPAETYAEYPLIILSQDGTKEISRVIADENGNYHATLPPGDYILDVQGRVAKRLRARPQQFKVVSNQTVRVDMDIDTGIR